MIATMNDQMDQLHKKIARVDRLATKLNNYIGEQKKYDDVSRKMMITLEEIDEIIRRSKHALEFYDKIDHFSTAKICYLHEESISRGHVC